MVLSQNMINATNCCLAPFLNSPVSSPSLIELEGVVIGKYGLKPIEGCFCVLEACLPPREAVSNS